MESESSASESLCEECEGGGGKEEETARRARRQAFYFVMGDLQIEGRFGR
jgi:hypothetical protein